MNAAVHQRNGERWMDQIEIGRNYIIKQTGKQTELGIQHGRILTRDLLPIRCKL